MHCRFEKSKPREIFLLHKPVKEKWVKKSESKCNMARSSLKDVEDINIQEKIFLGKHVADMQGELDLCGDTSAGQVDVSRGAEESNKKPAERGRIPSFLILLCLFLAKRGSRY